MKTNPFDESLRRKLEGVQPEFAEQDWNGFRKYIKAHKSANFWKLYKSRITIGIAASVVFGIIGLCGTLYQQNRLLRSEMEALKEVITQQMRVKSQETADPTLEAPSGGLTAPGTDVRTTPKRVAENALKEKVVLLEDNRLTLGDGVTSSERTTLNRTSSWFPETVKESRRSDITSDIREGEADDTRAAKSELPGFETLGYIQILRSPDEMVGKSRLSLPTVPIGKKKMTGLEKKVAKSIKIKESEKQKRALPSLVTSRPYRVGLSVSGTKQGRSFGLINEFLVGHHFSLAWGLTSTKFNDLYFLNEKTFAEQTSYNFRYAFGNCIPKGGYISNISAQCSLIQIPLSLGYRHALSSGFTLTGNVGTHLNASFKQNMECDLWEGYKPQRLSGLNYKKLNYPLVDNVRTSLGLEKNYDPIVFQGELFYHFQSKDIPYLKASEAGVRFKLLYQFGR